MKRHAVVLTAVCALSLGIAAPAVAQEAMAHRALVRVSPIALMFANFKVGAEYMLTENVAADVGFNHNRRFFGTELDITSVVAGARYYPTSAFEGFSVAGHLGMMRFDFEDDQETYPMLHVELAYSWLLGEARRFYVAPAIGAARIFASGSIEGGAGEEEDFDWSPNIPFPTWRLSVGYRF